MRVIAWQDKMMKVSECKTDCHETRGRSTEYFAKNIRPSFGWVVFFNHNKQTSCLWRGGKRKQVFTTHFGALCMKTNCQNPPPCCLFSRRALLCCLGNQHTRPVLMTGTPGIWSSSCYLSLLNTDQGIAYVQPTLCLYQALNSIFSPSVEAFWKCLTLCQVHPAAIGGKMLMSLWKLYF